jgi:hypothetical protein
MFSKLCNTTPRKKMMAGRNECRVEVLSEGFCNLLSLLKDVECTDMKADLGRNIA